MDAPRHPDFKRFEAVLRRRAVDGGVPLFELFSNITLPTLLALGQTPVEAAVPGGNARVEADLRNRVR